MLRAILLAGLSVGLGFGFAEARKSPDAVPTSQAPSVADPFDGTLSPDPRFVLAAATTTALASYNFDVGASCNEASWTKVDATAQIAVFWHVDDFAGANVNEGDSYATIAGNKSLWCGSRYSTNGLTCGYLTLPGYGNNWNQSWRTKICLPLTGNLDVSFQMETDSEPGYDATFLEYTADCTGPDYTDWATIDGGVGVWGGVQGPIAVAGSYAVGAGPVKVRIRFASDEGFSDEDANYDSHAGPVVIDNLVAESLALENFEGEGFNATTSNDWEGFGEPGYGQHMALFSGVSLVQKDVCAKNISCQWAAIATSSETYTCGGFPLQAAVPKGNDEGQYLNNEVWSPSFALAGTGSVINLQFTVYRDLALDGLVFYTWGVRSVSPIACQSAWRNRGLFYYGDQKDFLVETFPVGDLIPASAVSMRVRLAVVDRCAQWCGVLGSGACHSHAPLLDKVRVYRVAIFGPVFATRDIDMFQDTFPSDGTDTGIARADAALSITAPSSPTILPGDSVCIIARDPITATGPNPSGLATDALGGANGDKACYIWVHVNDNGVPAPPAKSGAALTDNSLYRFKDTQAADGKTWTRIQCWLREPATSTFVVDLNDNLFTAGDIVSFFFEATNTSAQTSYCSGSALDYVQSDLELAAELASEFTILPVNGNGAEGNNILYVDGMDGRGSEIFWDTAFGWIGFQPDRFDVRGPSSHVGNHPGARVIDVAQQLNANYEVILWDVGDLAPGLGDGTSSPEKSNDYAMVNSFLNGLSTPGGIFVSGDDYPSSLAEASGASAVTFKSTYITYSLTTGNHKPTFGTSPSCMPVPGRAFNQSLVAFGGCPLLNDFDVVAQTGTSLMQMTYGPPASNNGAVISNITGNARVMMTGFSFAYIRDDDVDGLLDRVAFLFRVLVFLGLNPPDTDVQSSPFANRLDQNYPNPFNPQTTIAFSIKERSRVRIDAYSVGGQLVRTLLDETRAPGAYSDVRWDGRDAAGQPVASGVYFYKLTTKDFSQTRKMVLLK